MTIDALQLVGWSGQGSRQADGQYRYTFRAMFAALTTVDGRLQEIDGIPFDLLRASGYTDEAHLDKYYPEAANGGSPSVQQVSGEFLQWLGGELQARTVEWTGAEVTAEVTPRAEA